MNQPRGYQSRDNRKGCNANYQAASDEGRAATRGRVATTPESEGSIDDERDKEHVADLGHDSP